MRDNLERHHESGQLARELFTEIASKPCISSHSHILPEKERLSRNLDVLALFGEVYPRAELIAAGMNPQQVAQIVQTEISIQDRWDVLEPYWERIRYSGYSQCIVESLLELYSINELTRETVGPVSLLMREQAQPGYYKELLHIRCHIMLSVMYMGWSASRSSMNSWVDRRDLVEVDRNFFIPLPSVNRLTSFRSAQQLDDIEQLYDVRIGSLKDHVTAIQNILPAWACSGIAGLKFPHSNYRALDFRQRSLAEAERTFDQLRAGKDVELESEHGRRLEDYLVFECCRIASELNLAVQFHVGMRAANNRSLAGANPTDIVPLLKAFPQVRFDFSHAGFPYLREAGILAKTFPNVYLNMSWIHIISPAAATSGLREWLQIVPSNKLIAFGDDLQYAELVCGHLKIARRNVSKALAEMIDDALIDQRAALELADFMFYENPQNLYRLNSDFVT